MIKKLILIVIFFINLNASNYNALLFNGNCVTCHFKDKSISAPSIVEIQDRYKQAFPDKKDFVDYMSTWVQYPNANTSLMDDAIQKYELMPELGYDLDTLEKISDYIYETDFKKE